MSAISSAPPSNIGSPIRNEDAEQVHAESIALLATKTIVIHPGSSLLRIGRASDPQPAQIPHVIAWRHKGEETLAVTNGMLDRQRSEFADNKLQQQKDGLDKAYRDILSICGRKMSTKKDIGRLNHDKVPQVYTEDCGWWWTDTSDAPECLIGDDALYADKNDCYEFCWPIVKGQLNITDEIHGSLSAVLASIEKLWTKSIENFLKISHNDLSDYRCVLLIPDIFDRGHIKSLANMLINNMQFSSILIHQESVCAAYGCGIATGCVVDVGHHKTTVCCVEDGLSHAQTRVCLDYGGRDIASVFAWLLGENNFPYRSYDPSNRMDVLLMDELKETFCHMDLGQDVPEKNEFHLRRPGQKSLLYPITLGFETMQAPFSVFYPHIFGLRMDSMHVHLMQENKGDIEDVFDDQYLVTHRNRIDDGRFIKREKSDHDLSSSFMGEDLSMEADFDDESVYSQYSNKSDSIMNLMSLDEAIVWSVENCPASYDDELKRRMYSCILLVGGGIANFKGADSFTTQKVQNAIPPSPFQRSMIEQVNVFALKKDQDPALVAWKGGSVLPCLDNAQELWISRLDWQTSGVKVLRERSPFIW